MACNAAEQSLTKRIAAFFWKIILFAACMIDAFIVHVYLYLYDAGFGLLYDSLFLPQE